MCRKSSLWLLAWQVLMSAQVRVGDPARAGQAPDVPAGQPGPGLVGALVEAQHGGAGVVAGAGVVVAQDARTVQYYLGKVFTKLAISSRSQLDRTLPSEPTTAQAE